MGMDELEHLERLEELVDSLAVAQARAEDDGERIDADALYAALGL
ncbi:hypothetical protein CLV28_1031 [Sediminihabitans luteus]|uniref:Uncharacterized protein n=1 Tax=Sediminihabitans luteus TaxID=1138585 RepID=A0A2M9D144_9CELL|nr:hypothetical protein CLV28_1031 [Sediminihabitans luteus]